MANNVIMGGVSVLGCTQNYIKVNEESCTCVANFVAAVEQIRTKVRETPILEIGALDTNLKTWT